MEPNFSLAMNLRMEQGSNKKGTAHAEAGSVPAFAGDGFRRSTGIPNEKALPLPTSREKGLSEKACDFGPQISKRTFADLNICLQSRRLFFFILLQFRQFLFEIVYLLLLFLRFFHPVHLQQSNGIVYTVRKFIDMMGVVGVVRDGSAQCVGRA